MDRNRVKCSVADPDPFFLGHPDRDPDPLYTKRPLNSNFLVISKLSKIQFRQNNSSYSNLSVNKVFGIKTPKQ